MQIVTKAINAKHNASDWPNEYSCNFLEPGLVSYEDVGSGIAMLRKETIMKFMNTFVGKPVVIDHIDVTPKDFKEHAVGYITKVWYDDIMNWACCNFILTEDKAKEKVNKGYSVSCAYDVHATGKGGEWHAIKYDEEILEGSGTHLALVLSPRYEDCRILMNSKKARITAFNKKENTEPVCPSCEIPMNRNGEVYNCSACGCGYNEKMEKVSSKKENQQKEESKMIQLFRKANDKAGAEVDPKDPTKQKWNAEGLFVIVENEYIPLSELAKHAKQNEYEAVQSVENEIEIDGKMHNVKDLVESYKASKTKKNEESEEDKKKKMAKEDEEKKENGDTEKSEKEEIAKKNAEDKDKEKEKKENEEDNKEDQDKEEETIKKNEKKDLKHFIKLNTARENGSDVSSVVIDTMRNRIDRGIDKYGTTKKD